MTSKIIISDNVKELISYIISKHDLEPVIDVKYYLSTQAGDGNSSEHISVDIIARNETFRLFVKYTRDIPQDIDIQKFYANETYFYDVVYPAYQKFLDERCIENGFRHVAKCFGTSARNVIALENLKDKGFTLFNCKKQMNDKHISLALKIFAKFHAVSFAFKDQEPKKYEEFGASTPQNFMMVKSKGKDSPLLKMLKNIINDCLNKLDPEVDRYILEKINVGSMVSPIADVENYLNEYSILIQGDCWCNNLMFLYENEDRENPIDITIIDWQLLRIGSPIFDFSYFFYSIADEEALSKLDVYLKEYYTELSREIQRLGSDPDQLYPFSVFEQEWKSYCKFGFAMAFLFVKFMLATSDEAPKLTEVDVNELGTINLFPKFKNQVMYFKRMRILCEFMVKNDYL